MLAAIPGPSGPVTSVYPISIASAPLLAPTRFAKPTVAAAGFGIASIDAARFAKPWSRQFSQGVIS